MIGYLGKVVIPIGSDSGDQSLKLANTDVYRRTRRDWEQQINPHQHRFRQKKARKGTLTSLEVILKLTLNFFAYAGTKQFSRNKYQTTDKLFKLIAVGKYPNCVALIDLPNSNQRFKQLIGRHLQ